MLPQIEKLKHLNSNSFFLIAGPCVIENKENPFEIAEKLLEITNKLNIPFIFKASYKKANRSKLDSFTGIGAIESLEIIKKIGDTYNIPTLTDVHSEEECKWAAKYVDVLQIPAFLCRQTDLLIAAGETGKVVNVKKGQFLAAEQMKYIVEKIKSTHNENIMLTDRGTFLGYTDLVVDFRSIPIMQANNYPVIQDVTHALQQPNNNEGITGGLPHLIETIAKAAIASGVDGIFIETHPEPHKALSDGANMLSLNQMESLLEKLVRIRKAIL